jgi:hypothetical protein
MAKVPSPGKRVGRPPKHNSAGERVKASREKRGLKNMSVDVPFRFAREFRHFANLLRDCDRWLELKSQQEKQISDGEVHFYQPAPFSSDMQSRIVKKRAGIHGHEDWWWSVKVGKSLIARGRVYNWSYAMLCVAFIETVASYEEDDLERVDNEVKTQRDELREQNISWTKRS